MKIYCQIALYYFLLVSRAVISINKSTVKCSFMESRSQIDTAYCIVTGRTDSFWHKRLYVRWNKNKQKHQQQKTKTCHISIFKCTAVPILWFKKSDKKTKKKIFFFLKRILSFILINFFLRLSNTEEINLLDCNIMEMQKVIKLGYFLLGLF